LSRRPKWPARSGSAPRPDRTSITADGKGTIAAKERNVFRRIERLKGTCINEVAIVMSGLEDRIRQRAYELWEQSGMTDGSEMDFWLQAEREMASKTSPEPPQDRLE
jgi:hypothetical protein